VTVVAVATAAGSSGVTTTAVLLAAMSPAGALVAECDPAGGDLAAWAQRSASPGWVTAVAGADRSWTGLVGHTQSLPSGQPALFAPPRTSEARTVVGEAASGFGPLLASLPDAVAVADCGRVGDLAPAWTRQAQLTLLLLRQSPLSAPATVAVVERTVEALDVLQATCQRVGVVLVGGAPYPAKEIIAALGVPLFGVLPDDRSGAGLVAGGWTIGRGAGRTPLARAAAELAARVTGTIAPTTPAPAAVSTNGDVT